MASRAKHPPNLGERQAGGPCGLVESGSWSGLVSSLMRVGMLALSYVYVIKLTTFTSQYVNVLYEEQAWQGLSRGCEFDGGIAMRHALSPLLLTTNI